MPPIVYLDRLDDRGTKIVSSIGDQPGPIGGDGWQVVSVLPTSRLQAGRQYAIVITGKIHGMTNSGTQPVAALAQVVLGDAAGTQHIGQVIEVGFHSGLFSGTSAIPFTMTVLISGSIPDPFWGSTWSNTFDLQLSARIYRRGDPATYSGSFSISDVVWMWADLDAIPAGDVHVGRYSVTTPLTPTDTWLGAASTALPGSPGDTWLHLWSCRYAPGVGAVPAFKVGVALDSAGTGFTSYVGGAGALGLGHTNVNLAGVRHGIGGMFWSHQLTAGDRPGLFGRLRATGSPATQFFTFDCVSIRLDDLPASFVRVSTTELALTDWTVNWPGSNRFYPLEIPAQGRTWQPWTFAAGIVDSIDPIDIWLSTDAGHVLWASQASVRMQDGLEAAQRFASAPQGIGLGDPDVQYRLAFLETSATTPVPDTVRDLYLVTVYPVKDPDNVPTDPSDPGPPVEIVPGAEGPGVGSLLDPPLEPNAQQPEQGEIVRHDLRGGTGYSRTWSTFLATRRRWSLAWGVVTQSQRDDLMAFLRANRAFRVTPPRDALTPVVQTSKPTWRQIDSRRFEVQVDVAELVFTEAP